MELKGQVALVTGAGRGIGREIALGLAREGVRVALLGRDEATLDERLAECAALGAEAMTVNADVTNEEQLRAAVGAVERHLGPLDLVVSNAGRRESGPAAPWEADGDDWWRTVETNLRGPYLVARTVLPGMVGRGNGRLLHMGSGMGHLPQPQWSAYALSKAALSRLTDTLAAALEDTGVTVLEMSPGLVRTDMTETMWGSPDEQPWNDVRRTVDAVVRFARGDLDPLHGRFVHAVRDDLDKLIALAGTVTRVDARTLRLRPYGPDDPLA
jgi:NAD(P)-dependent dehydrogenase (short-subunit alcohol dehydrogenase family)